ncbi:MAG: methionyl-tRNA formyltransferase [Candidatus Omnitrophica bacterium]|nr:methionyl-tRNA formyltransferase [Candidatus Omnitrophota bacterium]
MNILFAGNKSRGTLCLRALHEREHRIVGVLAHPAPGEPAAGSVAAAARELSVPLWQPEDVNAPAMLASLRALRPDLIVMVGYSPIVGRAFLELAPRGGLNLHGGKLPQYRGSSPMNWALINGEREFTISVVRADTGVDTGEVLSERTFPIGLHDTIADVQRLADDAFPGLLLDVVERLARGPVRGRAQDGSQAGYYPLRFPEDGLILWDLYTAEQAHNRIRALTDPYPGAFTWWKGRRVKLRRSALAKQRRYGEAGRVYLNSERGVLICAKDRCLWIEQAVVEDTGEPLREVVARYDQMATLRQLAVSALNAGVAL